MRFASAFRFDVKMQARHGFYYAYALISAVYVLILRSMPLAYRETADILLTFSDPSMLGFFFIGGLVLLEKGQGIYDSLFVTPFKPDEYLCSKTLSLTSLSLITSVIIHLSAFGFATSPFYFAAGTALTSIFFTLLGLGTAVRCQTVNGFFFVSTVYTFAFVLPLAETVELWDTPLFYLFPTKASLMLLGSAFETLGAGELLYCFAMLTVWIVIAYWWARRSFQRFIILKIGEGGGRR